MRNAFHALACASGLRAERDKLGLLPPRPDDEVPCGVLSHGRRPADTSGLRADRIAESAADTAAARKRYEDHKRHHQGIHRQCQAVGLRFLPFVVDAHGGGLGLSARWICARIAKAAAVRDGDEEEAVAADIVRGISTPIHRGRGTCVLRRFPGPSTPATRDPPEAWAEAPCWQ